MNKPSNNNAADNNVGDQQMEKSQESRKPKAVRGIAVLVVIIAIIAWAAMSRQTEAPGSGSSPLPPPAGSANKYKDGQYTASGVYVSPAGNEDIDIVVTLADGKITAAQFIGKTANPTSKIVQGKFNDGFQQVVVGKNIDEVNLTVVNGSSLTPKGFMDALNKVKAQAI